MVARSTSVCVLNFPLLVNFINTQKILYQWQCETLLSSARIIWLLITGYDPDNQFSYWWLSAVFPEVTWAGAVFSFDHTQALKWAWWKHTIQNISTPFHMEKQGNINSQQCTSWLTAALQGFLFTVVRYPTPIIGAPIFEDSVEIKWMKPPRSDVNHRMWPKS